MHYLCTCGFPAGRTKCHCRPRARKA